MSNRPRINGSRKLLNPNTPTKIKTPARIRMFHHVGDLSGCGTIRVVIPSMILNNYYSENYQFESMYNTRYISTTGAYRDCSYVTFQRSATEQQHLMIKHLKATDPTRKVIYEIDDDLLNIPEWNFASSFYTQRRSIIEKIMSECDGIVCSTEHLKRVLSPYNDSIVVSPNHLPRFIWGEPKPKEEESDKVRIMYAGSHNHFDQKGDKGDFSPMLVEYVKKTADDYQWIFVGGMPQSLKDDKRIINHFWRPVIEYPSFLKSLKPDIFLAPLEDNKFNASKSNIKALEAAALGIPLVASNREPYKDMIYTASTDPYFIGLVDNLAGCGLSNRNDIWRMQYEHLKDQLFWEDNEHKNLLSYVNKHLRITGKCL
jgi:glycosyltransferase involved in cell wall biosynthesis